MGDGEGLCAAIGVYGAEGLVKPLRYLKYVWMHLRSARCRSVGYFHCSSAMYNLQTPVVESFSQESRG